jgi:ABC-type multidrug transport system fused ATPase/permease subunit
LFSLDYTITDVLLIVCGAFFSIASGVPFPLLGIVFGELINDLNTANCSASATSNSDITDGVRQKVLYVIYITIANFGFIYIHCSCWSYASERIARRYRRRYFESIIRQETGYIEGLPAGDVISRLVSDIEVLQSGTSEKVGIVIATVSYFVTSYIVAFIKVPQIAGMLVSVVPCYFLMSYVGSYFIKKYAGRVTEHVNAATSIASSSLSHLTLVHAFNSNERLEKLFSDHLSGSRIDSVKKAATHAVQLGLLYFIAYSSNALAFWEGSRLIADSVESGNSGASVGAVYTVIFILIDASFILSQVAPFVHIFASAAGASERLLAVINRDSEIDGTGESGDDSAPFDSQDIIFRDVHFTYPSRPDVTVLKGVNFAIPCRKHTAIVGPSGGGKSTVVSLLERFYDPTSGELSVGGQDFRGLNVRYLRGNIGFVQQEPSLLDRSILENIAYGLVVSAVEKHQALTPVIVGSSLSEFSEKIRNGLSEAEALEQYDPKVGEIVRLVREAAASSNALNFIDTLPHGFATSVGPSGNHLSGGQKQRIALARALVREPVLLILDEATAALDSISERLIQEALAKLADQVTVVSIAHRLATAKDAHKIIVLRNGNVAEEGSHVDLVEKGGAYAEMVRLQNLGRLDPVATPHDSTVDEINEARLEESSPDASETLPGVSSTSLTKDSQPKYAVESVDEKSNEAVESKDEKENGDKKRKHSRWFTMKFTLSLLRPNMGYLLLGLAMSVLIGGSYIAEAVIFGHTVNSLSPCIGADSIRHGGHLYGLLFFIMAIVEFSANVIGGSAFGWAADKILYRIRVLSLRSLLSQTVQWHNMEGRTPSTLITLITSDATALSNITGTTIGLLLAAAVNLVAGLLVSFIMAWKITIVLLPTIPVLLVSGIMKLRTQAKFAERHQKAFAEATAITVEAVENIRMVSAFSLEKQSCAIYERALQAPYREILSSIAFGNIFLALSFSVSNLVYALAYWWGTRQVVAGLYSQTQFFIILPALLFSTQSCSQMFALAPDISKVGLSASNITELLTTRSADEEVAPGSLNKVSDYDTSLLKEKLYDAEAAHPEQQKLDSAGTPPSTDGIGIELQNVHFEYPSRPGHPVLRGLSLKIQPGQFAALVGPSGSGKSTIFATLERFYRPESGSVIFDGVDIMRQLGTGFRDDVALVPQENVLFEGSIAFNISLGARPGYQPTQEEIEEACRRADIHDVIMALPEGYQTQCNNNGKQFSGGQRQRLSIARALVRRPRLLLLDESTSALDVESEKRIQEVLANLEGRTTIVAIAHRLNTIHKADRIFLIEEGRCADQGTHNELVERSEMYRTSVIHQSLQI